MASFRFESYDSDMSDSASTLAPVDLATRLATVLPDFAARRLVLATPTRIPPPPGAWAPGHFTVQIVLRGRIELGIPVGDTVDWMLVTRRHLLAVCPSSWSPRTARTARNHISLAFGPQIEVTEYDSPAGGQRGAVQRRTVEPSAALAQIAAALTTCAVSAPQPAVLAPLIAASLPLLIAALRDDQVDDRPAAMRTWLQAHCLEELQRDAVAAHFGISPDHCTRLLGDEGFVGLVHRLRLERACALLRDPSLPLAEIAARCRLGSASYFIRLFRRRYRLTPAQWRRTWQTGIGDA